MNDTSLSVSDRTLDSERTMRGDAPARRLRPGDVLLSRYTVLSELGEGGMGVVYKCLDRVGGIEVAVKCLPPELSRNAGEMEGIRENYGIVAKLHHQAISGLRHLDRDPAIGAYYLVMDLAEGEDLSAILRRRRGAPMPLAEALEILRPLASALDYAHGEHVLHRDVKPANVKVRPAAEPGEAPRVQLLDFGLAAEIRSSMSRVSVRGHAGTSGTPSYMAPEQWEARKPDFRTDQYALAVMAYQMLAGSLPFESDDTDLLRRAVLSRAPDSVDGLSESANAALLRGLAKDPKDRFPTCTAFVAALARGEKESHAEFAEGAEFGRALPPGAPPDGGGARSPSAPHLGGRSRHLFVAALLAAAIAGIGWALFRPGIHKTPETVQPDSIHAGPVVSGEEAQQQTVVVTVDREGRFYLDSSDAPVTIEMLESELARRQHDSPDMKLVIQADAHVPYRRVMDIDRIATKLDLEARIFSLSSAGRTEPEPPPLEDEVTPAEETPPAEGAPATAEPETPAESAPPDEYPLALPPANAPRVDLEAAQERLEATRADLEGRGYAPTDPERAPAEEALAALEARIREALAEEAHQAREREIEERRAAAQRAADLRELENIRRSVGRRVSALDGTWTDGEFAKRRSQIAAAQRGLEECTDAASLPRAKELRSEIYDAVDWIERNTPARNGLAETERALDALVRDCDAASAATLAAESFRRAERARRDAAALRDAGRFEDAATGYASAKALYEKARAEARAAKASAEVESARTFQKVGLWDECLAAAEKALEWEPGNKDAVALKTEAEKNLRPTWTISATLPAAGGAGVSPAAGAKLFLGGQTYTLPVTLTLETGKTYGPGEVTLERGGRTYVGTLAKTTANWKGEMEKTVELKERVSGEVSRSNEPKLGGSTHRAGERIIVTVGGVDVALRWCPHGSFLMGSPTTEGHRDGDETQHRVTLTKGFWMGETEVTQGFWKEVMGSNPSDFKSGDQYPVEEVSWNDCQGFLEELNQKSPVAGFEWRLPTEAQWEYACRAGNPWAIGGTGRLGDMGWYFMNTGHGTHPVAQQKANAWGLYDMHGNVWEWCADEYGSYPSGTATDPLALFHPGSDRVNRGGSWFSYWRFCRSAYRSSNDPDHRSNSLGFRVVLVPVQ